MSPTTKVVDLGHVRDPLYGGDLTMKDYKSSFRETDLYDLALVTTETGYQVVPFRLFQKGYC